MTPLGQRACAEGGKGSSACVQACSWLRKVEQRLAGKVEGQVEKHCRAPANAMILTW